MTSSVVEAPDVTGLIELSRDPALDLKPVILRVQTDLFLAAPIHDRATISAFASLATGLIATVDDETALTVARKLAPFPQTPQAVLAGLAARGGPICATVIAQAPAITSSVVEAAFRSGTDVSVAIADRAERDRLGAAAAEAAERASAFDPAARLDRASLTQLVARARGDAELAAALLGRAEVAAGDLAPLWLQAAPERRAAIREAVAAVAALRTLPPPPREIGPVLTELSRSGDVKSFGKALAEALGLSPAFLTAAPDPVTRYELLTLALRAADLSEAEAVYVFLTLNAAVARSADRVFALVQLFRTVNRATARELLGAILDAPLPERSGSAEHRPYYAPDGAKPRPAQERLATRTVLPGRARQAG